jgi:hypothetical protein
MFAILISEENLPKIREHQASLPESRQHILESVYINVQTDWYYIQGAHDENFDASWSAVPQHFLDRMYEYDPEVIKTDWDQIVRK